MLLHEQPASHGSRVRAPRTTLLTNPACTQRPAPNTLHQHQTPCASIKHPTPNTLHQTPHTKHPTPAPNTLHQTPRTCTKHPAPAPSTCTKHPAPALNAPRPHQTPSTRMPGHWPVRSFAVNLHRKLGRGPHLERWLWISRELLCSPSGGGPTRHHVVYRHPGGARQDVAPRPVRTGTWRHARCVPGRGIMRGAYRDVTPCVVRTGTWRHVWCVPGRGAMCGAYLDVAPCVVRTGTWRHARCTSEHSWHNRRATGVQPCHSFSLLRPSTHNGQDMNGGQWHKMVQGGTEWYIAAQNGT